MTREWKPGQVAMVTDKDGRSGRGICNVKGGWDFTPEGADLSAYAAASWVTEVRPLITVDPESRVDFERIADMYDPTGLDECWGGRDLFISDLQEAFRRLVREMDTPPKPDEPKAFASVVVDSDGDQWVRIDRNKNMPWVCHNGTKGAEPWSAVDAVEVIREGL